MDQVTHAVKITITTKELYNLKGYNIDKTSRKQLWKGNSTNFSE